MTLEENKRAWILNFLLRHFTITFATLPVIYLELSARMAELVDASDSKSGVRKDVQVRFLFRARTSSKDGVLFFRQFPVNLIQILFLIVVLFYLQQFFFSCKAFTIAFNDCFYGFVNGGLYTEY